MQNKGRNKVGVPDCDVRGEYICDVDGCENLVTDKELLPSGKYQLLFCGAACVRCENLFCESCFGNKEGEDVEESICKRCT